MLSSMNNDRSLMRRLPESQLYPTCEKTKGIKNLEMPVVVQHLSLGHSSNYMTFSDDFREKLAVLRSLFCQMWQATAAAIQ